LTISCEAIEQDKKCRLKNEIIDGVQTYKNYHPTGKTLRRSLQLEHPQ
jgi:hypothetical protein